MMTEEENAQQPNPIVPEVELVEDLQAVKITAYSDELDSIKQETNSIELMRRLNDIVARIETDNLMDEMDVKLNQASDAVDELFREAQRRAA